MLKAIRRGLEAMFNPETEDSDIELLTEVALDVIKILTDNEDDLDGDSGSEEVEI